MPNTKIILIKHSSPQIVTGIAPENWVLSTEGQRRCILLAEKIAPHHPTTIITSEEVKAVETGKLLSDYLKIDSTTAPGLQEHDRSNVPHMQTSQFISMMELAFRKPQELIFGKEPIQAAADRLTKAIEQILPAHQDKTIAIVTHGAILAQWLADRSQESAFELWRKMGLPSFAVVDEQMEPIERVDVIK